MSGRLNSLGMKMVWLGLLTLLASSSMAKSPLQLEIGIQKRHSVSQPIGRVAVGNPAVADVAVINAREILITPLSAGVTNMTVWPQKGGDVEQLTLQVGADSQQAQQSLEQLGADNYSANAVGGEVQLQGNISSLEQHAAVRQSLGMSDEVGIDSSEMVDPSQVQIDIKIVEISKSRMQSAGFFLGKGLNGKTPRALAPPGGLTGATVGAGGISFSGNPVPESGAFNLIYGRQSNGLLAALSVLEGNGFAYTLAEPSLMAMSGQSANFLAGGEFPVPVRGSGFDNSVTIEYKEFGVRLSLTPTVLNSNRIALKVAPEVSELDFSAGIESGGVTVPALRVRRTDTSVALGDGESFVISGLISQNTVANVDKLPGLGDIPILGAFFRNNQLDRQDRELLMIVTPRLVKPIARAAKLPELPGERYRDYDPSFAEFLFNENGRFGEKAPVSSGFSK
ncbi:type II and III secretion system protein family protein [Methylophaga sp. OBS3]|uniref:type II and III secretion system protein family protein n=1 Tax=Methylophaga sp. OBS3 TaxID=2991934 RepID=UPI00225A9107|nr:type II and III secretion system protein family protein [Methylophaga sp. OBS3]MCX4189650.1 type II and III secretion system protein family protein [Methylophaga sp. OBS3]